MCEQLKKQYGSGSNYQRSTQRSNLVDESILSHPKDPVDIKKQLTIDSLDKVKSGFENEDNKLTSSDRLDQIQATVPIVMTPIFE